LKPKDQRSDVWERKCKNRFRAYVREKWIDLRQTKTKVISGPFHKIVN